MLQSFVKFGLVGGLGVFVNLGVLWLLRSVGVTDTAASAVAIEVSILSNFVLNERWTFRDRADELGREGLWSRAVRFQLVSGVGALLQWSAFVGLNVLWIYWGVSADASAHSWLSYQQELSAGAWHHVITSPPEVGAWVYLSQLIGIAGATAWNFLMNYYWTWAHRHAK